MSELIKSTPLPCLENRLIDKKKILVIQTAFLGDLILTIPLLKILKENKPDYEIHILCLPVVSEILKNNPYISEVIEYDKRGLNNGIKELFKLIKDLKTKKYDILISPHRSFRSTIISFLSNIPLRISFNKSSFSFLYNNKVEYKSNLHEIQRNLSLLNPLGIENREIVKPEFFPDEDDVKIVAEYFEYYGISVNDKLLVISPFSKWFTKKFPFEKYVKLINYLSDTNIKIVLIGTKNEFDDCEKIRDTVSKIDVFNSAGMLNLLQTSLLLKYSGLLLTNDSAPLHIANAVGTRVFAIFGATVPAFGFYPYGKNDKIFEINELKCRPCGIHGGEKCPIKSFDCMKKIDEFQISLEIKKSFGII